MKVKFVDLNTQYQILKTDILSKIEDVLDSGNYTHGPFVESFENNFATAHQSKYAVAVNNGTSALHLALMALNIGPNDEVIVPTNTFFASAEAISLVGATPVFVDCAPHYYLIDPLAIKSAITPKTKAIIVVHLYGQALDIAPIKQLATEHNLKLIEDCAQSHLAEFNNIPTGITGDMGCFSFYPGKNLGAYGEGGMVLTQEKHYHDQLVQIRSHGSSIKYDHQRVGHNFRMSGIQGGILDIKLKYLPQWTQERQKRAQLYNSRLKKVGDIVTPKVHPLAKHVYHLYVIRTKYRDTLQQFLHQNSIQTGIHYPIPCHQQKAYSHLKYKDGSCPVSEQYAKEILSLPMYPELPLEHIEHITNIITQFFKNHV